MTRKALTNSALALAAGPPTCTAWLGTGWRLTDMKRILFAIILLAGFSLQPALSQQSKVGDWTVEKRSQDQHCNVSRGYRDSEDENRDYAIVLSYSNDAIVMVLIYDGWEWDKVGDVLRADFSTDQEDIMRKAKWEVMDKTTVRGVFQFDQGIMDKLTKGKRLNLDFEDDDDDSIEVQVPRFGEALAALKFCEENKK
jgi:invasion protein IalB